MHKFSLVSLFIFSSVVNAIAQCSMCAASVDSNKGESLIGTGLNAGIIFLMVTPYLLLGTIGFVWYRYYKKSNIEE